MTTPQGLDEKVRRLDRSVHAIYAMLADILATQRRQSDWLEKISTRVAEISVHRIQDGSRLGTIGYRMSGIEDKLLAVSETQDREDHRLGDLDQTLGNVDSSLRSILELLRQGQ